MKKLDNPDLHRAIATARYTKAQEAFVGSDKFSEDNFIVDLDILIYRFCATVEQEIDWGCDLITVTTNVSEIVAMIDGQLSRIASKAQEVRGKKANIVGVISGKKEGVTNFRKILWPEYKDQRSQRRKPVGLKAVRERIMKAGTLTHCDVVLDTHPAVEADDGIAVIAHQFLFTENSGTVCLVSDDKDFNTIPGVVLMSLDCQDRVFVDGRSAARMLFGQVLMGDSADNYPGCPGIGKVKANKILSEFSFATPESVRSAWEAVLIAYDNAGLNEQDALLQANLAYIISADWLVSEVTDYQSKVDRGVEFENVWHPDWYIDEYLPPLL